MKPLRIKLNEGGNLTVCISVSTSIVACGLLMCSNIWKAGIQPPALTLLPAEAPSMGVLLPLHSDPG